MTPQRLHLAAAACGLVLAASAAAQPGFKGELDLEAASVRNSGNSVDAALGERTHADFDARLRLMWSGTLASAWSLDTAYVLEARHGGSVALTRQLRVRQPSLYIDPAHSAALRLNDILTDHGQAYAVQRLDRLALGYSGAHLVLRIGRQALTWGNGLVFHPFDLFNPFPPNATYTTYKPGSDMLYGQWLFDSGADFQAVVVPRRDPNTGRLAGGQSSAGIKWHGFAGPDQQFGLDMLLARDQRATVLGFGANGSISGATWTAEAVPVRLAGGPLRTMLLANLRYAWTWGERNVSGYLEYFRNGFGVTGRGHALADLPAPLTERLARGVLFTVARDYLAAGVELQWTPLLTLKPAVITNLDDRSALVIGQAVYSLSQNTDVTAGVQLSAGTAGTEYGGLETVANSGIVARPADQIYARFTWYF